MVIARRFVGACKGKRIADIVRAGVSIFTLVGVLRPLGTWVAVVDGARVAVVDVHGRIHAIARVLVADVCGASVAVVAVLGSIGTPDGRFARIDGTRIAVIAVIFVDTLCGFLAAVVVGACVHVIAGHLIVLAATVDRLAVVDSADAVVGAVLDLVDAGAGFLFAEVDGAQFQVVTILGLVVDADFRIARIGGTQITVFEIHGVVDAAAALHVAGIHRACVQVVAALGLVAAIAGIGVAFVDGAWVVVIASLGSVATADTLIVRIVVVARGAMTGRAIVVRLARALVGQAGIHGTQQPIVAWHGLVEELPADGVALVQGAQVLVRRHFQRVVVAQTGIGLDIQIARIQGTQVGVAGVRQGVFAERVVQLVLAVRAATADVGVDAAHGLLAGVFRTPVVVVTGVGVVLDQAGFDIAHVVGAGIAVVHFLVLVRLFAGFRVAGIVGTRIAVVGVGGRVVALPV